MGRWHWMILLAGLCTFLRGATTDEQVLVEALSHPKFWSSVHAAKYLTELQLAPDAVEDYLNSRKKCESEPVQRIGIWRVQALRCRRPEERTAVLNHLRAIAFAKDSPSDQVHAIETLFKLRYRCTEQERALLEKCSAFDSPLLQIYSSALLALQVPGEISRLTSLYRRYLSKAPYGGVLLYVLQEFPALPDELLSALEESCRPDENASSRIQVQRILIRHGRLKYSQLKPDDLPASGASLRFLLENAPKSEACQTMILQLAKSADIESRMLAAYAALKIACANTR